MDLSGPLSNVEQKLRIAVLWTELSGYMNSCLKELSQCENVELFVSHEIPSYDAPYDETLFSWIVKRHPWKEMPNRVQLTSKLEEFSPHLILSSGWNIKEHRYILKLFKSKAIRLISLDNTWHGTFKQHVGVILSQLFLHPICDGLFVAGERQADFAKKLGFKQRQILRGLLTCDHPSFSESFINRDYATHKPNSFVFIGRLVKEKGIDILIAAYKEYRKLVKDPWVLNVFGTGPLQNELTNIEGIVINGFFQPHLLPNKLLDETCLVLPSKFEPWALVVHEAASAGLGIICTERVGASAHLVQNGFNGYIVETNDVEELTNAMLNYSKLTSEERKQFSSNSYALSQQFTPQRWAKTLVNFTTTNKKS